MMCHKQKSASVNPFARRVAQRGEGLCKTRLRGFKSRRKFYSTAPVVYPFTQAAEPALAVGFMCHELGQRTINNFPSPSALGEVHIPRSPE